MPSKIRLSSLAVLLLGMLMRPASADDAALDEKKPADSGAAHAQPAAAPVPLQDTTDEKPAKQAAEVGNNGGGGPFREIPGNGAVLVGCEVTVGQYGSSCMIIKSVRPIFEAADGKRTIGTVRGHPTQWPVRVEAEEGYAVAKIMGRAGDRIDGICVVFMRRKDGRLDPNDKYSSRWLGERTGNTLVEVSGDDSRPAIGLSGRSGDDVDGIGLVFP